jgi:putative pyridoxal-dependent aspartate 1-decarboxylase
LANASMSKSLNTVLDRNASGPLLPFRNFALASGEMESRPTDASSFPPELLALFSRSGSAEPLAQSLPVHDTDIEQQVTDGLGRYFSDPRRPRADSAELARRFSDSRIPEKGSPADSYIRYLFEDVVPHSVRTHDPRFVGHMTSALPAFVGPLGRLITALNQNVVKLETSDALALQERQAIAILHRLVYGREQAFYDVHVQRAESTLGTIVSGGTLGNISALWCARNRRLGPCEGFAGIHQAGMSEALRAHRYRRAVVIGSSLMHYSLEKAVDLLGIGRQALIRVPATERGSIDVSRLEQALRRSAAEGDLILALVGVAGTTETGAVDPLPVMADLAAAYRCHFHVDAAWGGPVLFSRTHRHRLHGINRADSVTIDGHKQLYLPMGIGISLFRDPEIARSVETSANYIVRSGSADPGRRTMEGSRPAMALHLHGALHIVGQRGYETLIDEGIAKAGFLAQSIEARPAFELLAEPQLNIVVYRYIPHALREAVRSGTVTAAENAAINDLNRRLQEAQRNGGATFVSRTTLSNTSYGSALPIVTLRVVLANPLTTRTDLLAVLDEQVELGKQISAEAGSGLVMQRRTL